MAKSVDQKDASYESATKPRTSGCWHFLLRQWCLLHGGAPGCVFIPLRTAGVLCEKPHEKSMDARSGKAMSRRVTDVIPLMMERCMTGMVLS